LHSKEATRRTDGSVRLKPWSVFLTAGLIYSSYLAVSGASSIHRGLGDIALSGVIVVWLVLLAKDVNRDKS
jgi:hypothetical protein